jgi:hypothetical protein
VTQLSSKADNRRIEGLTPVLPVFVGAGRVRIRKRRNARALVQLPTKEETAAGWEAVVGDSCADRRRGG